jgi:hypothetical protein
MIPLNELEALAVRWTGPDRRILDRLDRTGDCWLWTGPTDARGRARVSFRGKNKLHHRAVWEILVGPIPAGALLCHHCDNPRCANRTHLYVGDGKSNVADMFARGRHWTQVEPERASRIGRVNGHSNTWSRGASNPKAKLAPAQVDQIRGAKGSSYTVAAQFGVDASTVQRIRRGATWA